MRRIIGAAPASNPLTVITVRQEPLMKISVSHAGQVGLEPRICIWIATPPLESRRDTSRHMCRELVLATQRSRASSPFVTLPACDTLLHVRLLVLIVFVTRPCFDASKQLQQWQLLPVCTVVAASCSHFTTGAKFNHQLIREGKKEMVENKDSLSEKGVSYGKAAPKMNNALCYERWERLMSEESYFPHKQSRVVSFTLFSSTFS